MIKFPRPQLLVKSYLDEALQAEGIGQPVSTKNPSSLPPQWVRVRSEGGPQELYEWRCTVNLFVCALDEIVAENNSNIVHSLMLQVPGVGIKQSESSEPYPWVRLARHVSGPMLLDPDEDLPQVEVYRIVVTWHILPLFAHHHAELPGTLPLVLGE